MPKEFNVIDLLSKLSANSFLIQTQNERLHITPGVFLGMPGKFFLYVDILDAVMKNLYVNGKGEVVVSLEDLQKSLNQVDLNQYFVKLESTIQNKDILGINEEQKQYPISDVKVVENKELPQPTTPTIGELKPKEKTEQNETTSQNKESGETQQTKSRTYTNKQYSYQKNKYNKNSADSNTFANGKTYHKNRYGKTYKKSYKKSDSK